MMFECQSLTGIFGVTEDLVRIGMWQCGCQTVLVDLYILDMLLQTEGILLLVISTVSVLRMPFLLHKTTGCELGLMQEVVLILMFPSMKLLHKVEINNR